MELQTTNNIRHYTDSHGVVAFHEPGLMNRRVFFAVKSHGYEFPKGDTVRLQLLGRDAPYYRASNGTFAIEASNVTVTLPTK